MTQFYLQSWVLTVYNLRERVVLLYFLALPNFQVCIIIKLVSKKKVSRPKELRCISWHYNLQCRALDEYKQQDTKNHIYWRSTVIFETFGVAINNKLNVFPEHQTNADAFNWCLRIKTSIASNKLTIPLLLKKMSLDPHPSFYYLLSNKGKINLN